MNMLLQCENTDIGYKKPIVKGINFKLEAGEIVALLGKNGIGKSTFIRTLTGELSPKKGDILLEGKPLKSFSSKSLAQKLAIVTTEHLNAGGLKVKEIVSLGRHPYTGIFGRLKESDLEIVEESIENVGIKNKSDNFFNELSDGEKQKVMIARALAQDTPIIILDEPFSFLDVSSRVEILSLLKELAHDKNKGILFSCHDVSHALRMCDKISAILFNGEFFSGTKESLLKSGKIEKLFESENIIFSEQELDFISKK